MKASLQMCFAVFVTRQNCGHEAPSCGCILGWQDTLDCNWWKLNCQHLLRPQWQELMDLLVPSMNQTQRTGAFTSPAFALRLHFQSAVFKHSLDTDWRTCRFTKTVVDTIIGRTRLMCVHTSYWGSLSSKSTGTTHTVHDILHLCWTFFVQGVISVSSDFALSPISQGSNL